MARETRKALIARVEKMVAKVVDPALRKTCAELLAIPGVSSVRVREVEALLADLNDDDEDPLLLPLHGRKRAAVRDTTEELLAALDPHYVWGGLHL